MRQRMTSRGASAALASALTLLVVGGSYAIASGGGQIHACASKRNGMLRLAKHCTKKEKGVSWNARGPKGAMGATGATGANGPPGGQGVTGPRGSAGATNVVERANSGTIPANGDITIPVDCQPGEVATGGGAFDRGNSGVYLYQSGPSPANVGLTPNGWIASFHNTTATPGTGIVFVICASP
jgi:hypothetical protein